DEIITFQALTRSDLKAIVDIQAARIQKMLAERQMHLVLSDAAKAFIAEKGYDPAFGARPIKRTLQRYVADPLALALLEGRFHDGDTIEVDAAGDELMFRKGLEIVEGELMEA
ncbi:MAG: ATP-dependent Clp protease ATP-binding subunit, partial [Anaerolineales bacterium]|nr:ATP-dependent Clp protease ATP-binding subunit [Anaerolineales bacterium]